MPLVLESFDLSLQVENRVKALTESRSIDDSEVVTRSIGVARYVQRQWDARRNFYREDETHALHLPPPKQLHYPTFAPFRCLLHSEDTEDLKEICRQYRIDKHSALSWGLDCIDVFEETLMTHRIFVRGPGTTKQLVLKWIG